MPEPRLSDIEASAVRQASGSGRLLADAMPRLILEARRVAATVIHGLHGRRRAGPGENFWQYRRFMSGEPASNVDWRRSARDDHLYVREREWEASHTVWIWPDRSPSMAFASALVADSKLERALVVAFALAEVLVQGGERVGIPGLLRPTASRNVIDKMAQAILHDPTERASLPVAFAPSPLAEIVLLSDLWSPIGQVQQTIAQLCPLTRSGGRAEGLPNDLPVAFALVASDDQAHMRRFLKNLKTWGLSPEVVVTDGSNLDPDDPGRNCLAGRPPPAVRVTS